MTKVTMCSVLVALTMISIFLSTNLMAGRGAVDVIDTTDNRFREVYSECEGGDHLHVDCFAGNSVCTPR